MRGPPGQEAERERGLPVGGLLTSQGVGRTPKWLTDIWLSMPARRNQRLSVRIDRKGAEGDVWVRIGWPRGWRRAYRLDGSGNLLKLKYDVMDAKSE